MIPKACVQTIRTVRAGNTAQRLNACLFVCVKKTKLYLHLQHPHKDNTKIQRKKRPKSKLLNLDEFGRIINYIQVLENAETITK